jgi:hypothetical protein
VPAPPGVDRALERQLVEALTKGDVPEAEFSNLLRNASDADRKLLLERLAVEPPPTSDVVATAFYRSLPPTRDRIVSELRSQARAAAVNRLWGELASGEDTTAITPRSFPLGGAVRYTPA